MANGGFGDFHMDRGEEAAGTGVQKNNGGSETGNMEKGPCLRFSVPALVHASPYTAHTLHT